jgi:outer membrane protein TolC
MIICFFILVAAHAAPLRAEPLTLQDCVDIALENNSAVILSEYSTLDAQAKMDEAFSRFLPKLTGKASYMRYDSVPTAEIPGFGTLPFGTRDNYNLSVELVQPLFTGGRIKNYYSATKSAYDSAKKGSAAKKKDVIQEVTNKYFNVLKVKKLVEIAQSSRDLIDSHLKNVENFFEAGVLSKNDLLSAKVSLANAQNFLIRAKNSYELAKSSLNYTLNRDVNEPVVLQDIDENTASDEMELEKSIDQALKNREEISIINNTKNINESLVNMEKSAYYPQLYFIGSYNESGEEFPLRDEYYAALLTLELKIFDWGETSHKVESSKIALKKTFENETIIINSIKLEVKSAYLQLKQAQEEINATKQAVAQAEENYRIYEARFAVNAATSTEVLDAENLILQSKINYFQALYDFHIAKINLKRATGGA